MVEISVIIPVYNTEKYLNECLDSVVNQTFSDIEIICVNDGSTDNSLAILESYAKKDNRITVISQENNGQGSARNLGLKNSSGNYICFIDSDDYVDLNMLEKLYDNVILNNSDIVVFKIARFNDNFDEINYDVPGFDFDNIFDNIDFNNYVFNYNLIKHYVLNASFAPWTKLYKKEFLEFNGLKFSENYYFEDILFHIKSFLYAKNISFSPYFLYYYRYNPNSSVNTSDNGFDIFKSIDDVETFLIDEKYYGEFKNEFDLFKITQITNYILTTKSEDYYQMAKNEFEKINLSPNYLLSDSLFEKYELILNSDTLIEYIEKHIEIISYNSNIKINQLICENDYLSRYNESILNKNEDLTYEINCINKQNKILIKKNKKLIKQNKNYKKKYTQLESLNKSILNSKSWSLTSPLRKVKHFFKK